MKTINSFKINHSTLEPGFYLRDYRRGVLIYDLRFVKPNTEFIHQEAIHTIEHWFAYWLKNSCIKENVISFCPGGCQTMFYLEIFNDTLLTKNLNGKRIIDLLIECIDWCLQTNGIPGAVREQCGNYLCHSSPLAKTWLQRYKEVLIKQNEEETRTKRGEFKEPC